METLVSWGCFEFRSLHSLNEAGCRFLCVDCLQAAVGGLWPSNYVGEGPFKFPNPNTVYVKGAANLAVATKSTYGTYGHAQVSTQTFGKWGFIHSS